MNTKQKQALLFYLGYYVGAIDGVLGSGSREAIKAFQRDFFQMNEKVDGICGSETEQALKHAVAYGMPAKKQDAVVSGDFWTAIKYFKKAEFRCRCGCGADSMDEKLICIAE
jgi:peptidoglycan hydrolase-like protein with peptidoglycan-binding domain